MRSVVAITKDVCGADYAALVSTATARYAGFSLVWRDQLSFDQAARSIQQELRRFEVARARTACWPGTRLIGTRALVVRYRMEAAHSGVLTRAASLFAWRSPGLPEDLCFYAADGGCAIATVSHEQCAWFFDGDWFGLVPASAEPEVDQLTDREMRLFQLDE